MNKKNSNASSPPYLTHYMSSEDSPASGRASSQQSSYTSNFTTMSENEGASYKEQILECARRNNVELFTTIKQEVEPDQLALLLNSTTEMITNNSPLHIATLLGNWEFIDAVLDVEGVEIDPLNRDGDTPLHLAVKFAGDEPEYGYFIIDNLVDAGSDAKIVDRHGLKPVNYVRDNEKLRSLLESAEYGSMVPEVPEEPLDDEGSASDSD